MKEISLLIILQIVIFTGFSQNHKPVDLRRAMSVNLSSDTQQYKGYTIGLTPSTFAPRRVGSYGINIFKDNKPVMRQVQNPVLFSTKRTQKKRRCFKNCTMDD